jgi:hypothetical protein
MNATETRCARRNRTEIATTIAWVGSFLAILALVPALPIVLTTTVEISPLEAIQCGMGVGALGYGVWLAALFR